MRACCLLLVACTYNPPPATDPDAPMPDGPIDMPIDVPVDMPASVYVGYSDATTNDTPGFYLYSVWGTSSDLTLFPGTFFNFGTTRVTVDILNIDCNTSGPTEKTVVTTLPVIVIGIAPTQKYQMSKNIGQIGNGLVTGNCYRIKPKLDGFTLGFSDFQVTSGTAPAPMHRATPGSNLTVKFRTESSLNTDTDGDGVPDWRDP